ncbi:MAG TPA: hypothetical protein VJ574_05965, partial [Candidatus Bathyarchaeia archaeon]|nr:hypothetical protein [Candidatus Bathyarchaeia archaeon]
MTERSNLPIGDIAKVLYAPRKAFQSIIQNPRLLVPILVLIMFMAAQLLGSYMVLSKSYLEESQPTSQSGDIWTENATFWSADSGVTISNNYADCIKGSYYGNSSIQFEGYNSSQLLIRIPNLGQSLNCSPGGFGNLSMRVKIIAPQMDPVNVSIYLYSLNSSNFRYDLSRLFSEVQAGVWNNITIPVGSGNWISSRHSASWSNITGFEMDLAWPSSSGIVLRVDGLFFRGLFESPLEISAPTYIADAFQGAFTKFIMEWLILTGITYMMIKAFKGNVTWKPLMMAVGLALIAIVLQAFVTIVIVQTTLPTIYYTFDFLAGVPGEVEQAAQALSTS